jgi:ubiquinone/menaquinone biosynthesis C-methylase UbiE
VGFYTRQVLPRLLDVATGGAEVAAIRRRVAAGLAGEVLEVGFGSGLNVPHYPATVTRVLAVDPAVAGRKLAAKRIAAVAFPVEFAGLDGETLPLADASVDHALATWTLCSIPDPDRALSEIRRVLRPAGRFHFAEHGLSPDARVARWQRRLTPLQRRFFGNCHLNRPIGELVAGSGLEILSLRAYYIAGPKTVGYVFEGVAARP